MDKTLTPTDHAIARMLGRPATPPERAVAEAQDKALDAGIWANPILPLEAPDALVTTLFVALDMPPE